MERQQKVIEALGLGLISQTYVMLGDLQLLVDARGDGIHLFLASALDLDDAHPDVIDHLALDVAATMASRRIELSRLND